MADQQSEQQVTKKHSWDVNLPGNDYVLQQWLVRNGSAVQQGDKLATAVKKGTSTTTTTTTGTAGVVKHKRPKKRKRVTSDAAAAPAKTTGEQTQSSTATDASTNKPSPVKKLSAYLPQTPDIINIVAPVAGIIRIKPAPSLSLKIASIEPCQHPAIMGGLCAVCGASIIAQQPQAPSATLVQPPSTNNNNSMSQVTVSGGVTMTISEAEAHQISQQNSDKLCSQKKLSLVLDLDHTLVHATADVRARSHYLQRSDVRTLILPIQLAPNTETRWMQHYVKLRPHVEEFLKESQELYQISVYTAGTRMYAEHVCMLLSRNMVGATKDEEELQRMRHEVLCAEYELASLNKKKKSVEENKGDVSKVSSKSKDETAAAEKEKESSKVTNGDAASNDKTANDDGKKDNDGSPSSNNNNTKKRVSFGEPPQETKTDAMTPERLETLKQELQQAEKLEQEALEVRQQVFGSRIVSRTDVGDLGRDVKSLERIFPGGGSMALIVDDREDVWANAEDNSKTSGEPPENLLLIRPYHWEPFSGFADVNNAAGEDISGESTTTEDEEDCALLWTLDILKRVHKRFYDAIEETGSRDIAIPPLLREMRRQVLQGCILVYSGLVPLHHQIRSSQLPRPNVYRYGESLGAKVLDSVDNTVTHCVAHRDGTDKVHKARRVPGCVVVKPSWLMECVWTITRRDVTPHLLGKSNSISNANSPAEPVQATAEPTANESSSDDDDDDDDLAAMLEADMKE